MGTKGVELPFGGRPIPDSTRRAHDRHDFRVVLLVLAVLAAVAYLWSDCMVRFPFPGLAWLTQHSWLKWSLPEGHFAEQVWIDQRQGILGDQNERLLVLALAAAGFLCAYYLPLRAKKIPLVALTLLGVAWAFGPQALGALLATHAVAFLTFHGPRRPLVAGPVSALLAGAVTLFFLAPAEAHGSLSGGSSWRRPSPHRSPTLPTLGSTAPSCGRLPSQRCKPVWRIPA